MENLGMSWDNPKDVEIFYEKMDSKSVRKEVCKNGDVIIMSTNSNLLESNIVVVGSIFCREDGTIKNLS